MYIELILVTVIALAIVLNLTRANTGKFFSEENEYLFIFKEKDYDFLLITKYGDKVYNPNEVYVKRAQQAIIVLVVLLVLLVILNSLTYINLIIICVISGYIFKSQYLNLRKYYKKHLSVVDSLLPYYLKSLEILIHHYTVPVALSKSIVDAPSIFKPGLKKLVKKIEEGDSSIDPYMEFAIQYPVKDSMRMMRLLYRLGLGEQEKKHEQLLSFAKNVSNLQAKAREDKYKARLERMEKQTMIMLVCTGGGTMLLLIFAMVQMMNL